MAPETIKIIRQLLPWKPKFGDINSGGKYVKCPFTEEMLTEYEPIPLTMIADFSWLALKKVGITDVASVQKLFQYKCPWSDNTYYRFMPWLLLTKDRWKYIEPENSFAETAFDSEWTRDMVLPNYFFEMDGSKRKVVSKDAITQAMLGHGYTDCTLPFDGHSRNIICCLELNNGDLIAGWLYVWFNK